MQLGGWILREACIQGRRWLDAGILPFSIVVNMTVRQLRSGGLAGQVREALRASGLPPGSLLIEIPETAVRQLSEPITQALSEITASGAQLSIDDFGTGYASLPTLQRLRASAVCIDRTLIEGVPREGTARHSRARSSPSPAALNSTWSQRGRDQGAARLPRRSRLPHLPQGA